LIRQDIRPKEAVATAIHALVNRQRDAIMASTMVGCCDCLGIFPATDIKEWTDRGQTAICPHCWVDFILPDAAISLSVPLLKAMHSYWF
jgi:hypothetical protein